jgi:hypothetical protein
MSFANEIKDLFSYPKLYSVFLHPFWFWRRRFLKEMLFLAHCEPCVYLMKLLCTKFVGTNPNNMCAKNKVCRCISFWEEEVWSNCWRQLYHLSGYKINNKLLITICYTKIYWIILDSSLILTWHYLTIWIFKHSHNWTTLRRHNCSEDHTTTDWWFIGPRPYFGDIQ